MAKEKHTAPYFLHDVDRGYKMRRVIKKFGNDGYAIWYSLLEQLCTHEQYYIFVDEDKLEDLSEYCNVNSDLLIQFLDYTSKKYPDHFDYELWSEYHIIRNNKLMIDLIERLYEIEPKVEGKGNSKKRKGKVVTNTELKEKYKSSKREVKPKEKEREVKDKVEVKVKETKVKEDSVTERKDEVTPKIPEGISEDMFGNSEESNEFLNRIENYEKQLNGFKTWIGNEYTKDKVLGSIVEIDLAFSIFKQKSN